MKQKFLNIIGLMSGTSLDGIDISYVKSNGIEQKTISNTFSPFNNQIQDKLHLHLEKRERILKSKLLFKIVDNYISYLHFNALKQFIKNKKVDIIGFHGQTIVHDPKNKLSIQLGNSSLLSNLLKKKVISDFRLADINNGGLGAPIAPVYHKKLIEDMKLELPAVWLNIGGIANLTYWDGKKLIGFDTGPGNCLMNDWSRITYNKNYDFNGVIASKGKIIKNYLNILTKDAYFFKSFPKSLDKLYFNKYTSEKYIKNYNPDDVMTTLCEFTARTISDAFKFLPNKPINLIVSGGGNRNPYLIKRILENSDVKLFDSSQKYIDSDFIESELIAFLTARSFYNLPISYPGTTGVLKPISGGNLYFPTKNH